MRVCCAGLDFRDTASIAFEFAYIFLRVALVMSGNVALRTIALPAFPELGH
jgi:hypothetical protein